VFVPSPPQCSTPGGMHEAENSKARGHPQPQVPSLPVPRIFNQAESRVPAQAAEMHNFHQDLAQISKPRP